MKIDEQEDRLPNRVFQEKLNFAYRESEFTKSKQTNLIIKHLQDTGPGVVHILAWIRFFGDLKG